MKRWLARIGIGIAALVAIMALLTLNFVRLFERSVPSYDGTISVAGLAAPVQIARDAHAIPHITANSFDDAAFALGYVHAQDRLWQMELARRFVQGRLAELLGEAGLAPDITMRTLGLYRAAQEALPHLSPATRRALQAYADGVNAYIADHTGPLPIEFALAGDTPDPWTPADSVAVLKGMSFTLSENAFREIARAKLLHRIGRRGLEDFFPPYPGDPVLKLPDYLDTLFGTTQLGAADPVPDTTASNNWVVDGAHSITGKPLLANDPHLPLTIPSTWYLAHLAYPGHDVVGGTLPGIPAIIAGRNRHTAWGLTNTGPDTQDLYVERINPEDPDEYQVPRGWARFDSRDETIKVRFGGEQRITVRATRHGPVLPEHGGIFANVAPKNYVVALAWTALMPDDTTMNMSLEVHDTAAANDFTKDAVSFVTPMQNFIFADDAGHIGLMLPGRVPMRATDNDSLGVVPAPGWDARYDWQGYVPVMATIIDPPSGRIATANNKTVPPGYAYVLTHEWEDPYRFQRIDSLLAATAKHSLQSFEAIQRDTVDTYALVLKSFLIAAGPFEGTQAVAAKLVANWDGAMRRDEAAPLIFAAWGRALAKRIYADELGSDFDSFWGYRPQFTLNVLNNVNGEGRWCDDHTTPRIEDCRAQIRLALHDAIEELSNSYGNELAKWRWGDAHHATMMHRPLGSFPIIGGFFNREIEADGGANTILRGDYSFASKRPYAAIHGAGYRAIYDLADPDASVYMISTGESGNVFSPYYDDLMPLWAAAQYITIPTAPEAVAATAKHLLTLRPR